MSDGLMAAGGTELIAVVVAMVGMYLAFKAVRLMVRLVIWAVVLGAAYFALAPVAGWPSPF